MDVELLDLHDYCYARQDVVDNDVNRRPCELLEVIEKLRGECDCEAAMSDFEKNPTVIALQEKLPTLSTKIASLEAEKERLEAVKVSLRKEVDDVKQDKMEVVSKVVPYAAMELIRSNDLGSLVGRLVSSAIFYGRCKAFEQVAVMKDPFDLSKVKGYHPSYKKEHDQAGNDLATTTCPWLSEFIADPSAPVEKATPSIVPASNLMSPPADGSFVNP
ncbi:hypothetical protein Tco_1315429 [Tanacetum coccineum]